MKEIWKDIEGYEGEYQVSNMGNVKSLKGKEEKILKVADNGHGYLQIGLCKNRSYKYFYIHRLVCQAFLDNPNNLPQVNHKDENKANNCVSNLEWCSAEYNRNYGTRTERAGKTLSKNMRGENHHMYGKHHTEETKRKISEAHKGKHLTEEAKKKLSETRMGVNNPMYGKHHTIEVRKKISEVNKGDKHPQARTVLCIETGKTYSTITQCAEELGLHATHITAVCKGKLKTTGKLHFTYVD